ncbi:hypothetical protein BCR34DRAFT_606027 [Clohesyomyces aquaticus]|uniref:Uncharacterized protein n=1 Tax=Clohesyomyces aquaticus TaxID=1231657 RepID=A0A1Y1YUD8_9PLEO|nr:hypothetical protein BCR34DRAFT_606027 [Clohesyomyces aquaticus]
MLAAIVLERFRTPLGSVPTLSITRSASSGPQNLLWAFLHSSPTLSDIVYLLPFLGIFATSITSQFTSTILLSDFNQTMVLGQSQRITLPYGVLYEKVSELNQLGVGGDIEGQALQARGYNHWKSRPLVYPTFAEYNGDPYEASDLRDTGRTIRALIPYSGQTDRMSLVEFNGATTLINTVVVCVRPTLDVSVSLQSIRDVVDYNQWHGAIYLSGTARCNQTGPMFRFQEEYISEEFTCQLAIGKSKNRTKSVYGRADREWSTSLCAISGTNGSQGMWGELSKDTWDTRESWDNHNREYLVLNATGRYEDWYDIEDLNGFQFEDDHEWAHMVSPQANLSTTIKLSVSLCFVNFEAEGRDVIMSRSADFYSRESVFQWSSNTEDYVTDDIRHTLGATEPKLPLAKRGVLDCASWAAKRASHTLGY